LVILSENVSGENGDSRAQAGLPYA
jgi:hypothetical protein